MAATKQEELDFLMTEEGDNSEPSGILPAGGTRLRLVAPLGVFMVLAVIAWLALSPSVDPVAPKRFSRRRSHRSGSGIAGFSMFGGDDDDDDDYGDLLGDDDDDQEEWDDDHLEEKSHDHIPTFQEALAYDKDEDGLISKEELLTLFGNANAEDQAFWESRFRKADKDGDGGLDEEEFGKLLNVDEEELTFQDVRAFDKDEDGLLSKEELLTSVGYASAEGQAFIEERFPEADKDRDGGLDEEEFGNLMKEDSIFHAVLAAFDKDQDGLLSMEELLPMMDGHAEMQAVWERRFPTADKDGNGGLDEEEFGPFLNADLTFQETLAYDKDQDGLLSKEELLTMADGHAELHAYYERRFPRADKDGNGGLDEEEFGNFSHEDATFQETLAYDKDQDGLLSKKELIKWIVEDNPKIQAFVEEHWTEFDTNGDGLDEKEFGHFLNETRF